MREIKSAAQDLRLRHSLRDPFEGPAVVDDEPEDHDHTCIICMDAPRTRAFAPCGHAVVCMDCSKLVMASGSLCPMCREHIAYCKIHDQHDSRSQSLLLITKFAVQPVKQSLLVPACFWRTSSSLSFAIAPSNPLRGLGL